MKDQLKHWAFIVYVRCRSFQISIRAQHTIVIVTLSALTLFLGFLLWLSIVV